MTEANTQGLQHEAAAAKTLVRVNHKLLKPLFGPLHTLRLKIAEGHPLSRKETPHLAGTTNEEDPSEQQAAFQATLAKIKEKNGTPRYKLLTTGSSIHADHRQDTVIPPDEPDPKGYYLTKYTVTRTDKTGGAIEIYAMKYNQVWEGIENLEVSVDGSPSQTLPPSWGKEAVFATEDVSQEMLSQVAEAFAKAQIAGFAKGKPDREQDFDYPY